RCCRWEKNIMPIHDWTRVDAGLFHAFHQQWICALSDSVNLGGLPADYFALIEQDIRGPMPDVLNWRLRDEINLYADKADHIAIRHQSYYGGVIAVIEIVSPGNKASRAGLQAFVNKTAILIHQKVHLLVIDLFPSVPRDPGGIHKAIWDEIQKEDFELPP